MTTAQQIKKLVRPLLERNHDVVLVGPASLCVLPVHHVARLINLRRSSSQYFNIEWRLIEVFIPQITWVRTFGWCYERIGRSESFCPEGRGGGNWYWSDTTIAADFIAQVEKVVLPRLRSLHPLEASASFIREHPEADWCLGKHWPLAVDVSLGNLEAARISWEGIERHHPLPMVAQDGQVGSDRFRDIGQALMANHRVALARILHRIEAERIVGSPFEPYWKSVPFPLELRS